jgi:hypothetical protein
MATEYETSGCLRPRCGEPFNGNRTCQHDEGAMIRPASEIEYPASAAQRNRASMIARMEALNRASHSLMGVIAERIGAEEREDAERIAELTAEQERLIANMRALARAA